MSKMIAVCGAPGSGKTTAALKIAEEIYYAKKGSVIFLSPDLNVPCHAYIFPNCKEAELYSVGVALDRTDIYREDVFRQMNHVKTTENFGFLGYKAGENSFSYPESNRGQNSESLFTLKGACGLCCGRLRRKCRRAYFLYGEKPCG